MIQNNIHVLSRSVIIDQGHIVLCKTLDLPISFYFLPGDHVEHGESVETSLLRELIEKTGASLQDTITIFTQISALMDLVKK